MILQAFRHLTPAETARVEELYQRMQGTMIPQYNHAMRESMLPRYERTATWTDYQQVLKDKFLTAVQMTMDGRNIVVFERVSQGVGRWNIEFLINGQHVLLYVSAKAYAWNRGNK